jgi:single-strand DNA-binding protein
MSVNKVILIGNLGRDVELRHTPGGATVAKFSIATNEKWKDKAGQLQEHTEWHNIVAWGKLAEFCGSYLSKGRQIYIEGMMRTRTYDDEKGNRRYFTEVRANVIQLLGPKPGGGGGGEAGGGAPAEGPDFPPDNDDEIPF